MSATPKSTSSGPDLYIERGTHILDNAERKPILYDHRGKPIVRETGFRCD